jgi:fructokinase
LVGPDAIAGEWGHNPLPWLTPEEYPGPACWCGQRGCIETFLSGPALARAHTERTGEALSAGEIAERAARGDGAAVQTLDNYVRCLARALASIINLLNPDAIVLGGGVSNIPRLYTDVPRLWGRYVFSDSVSTRLVRAKHGDSSGVRGAAWLWPE